MLLDLLGINKVIKQIKCRLQKLEKNTNTGRDFIPLTGTEEGSLVTGNIELDGSNNPVKIISQSGTHSLTIDDIGTMSLECRESNFYSNFGVGGAYIGFYSDNPNFRGIEGYTDFSEIDPNNKLIYAQRSYVDKAVSDSRPYKVYTALLSQSGTDAPVATVLENTLGETISFGYGSPGYYSINTTGEFPQNKTTFSIKNVINGGVVSSETYIGIFSDALNTNTIDFTTLDDQNTAINNILLNTPIEIRVYN